MQETKTLALPALFIHGAEDGVNPPETSENARGKFTGPFERMVLPGVGHFPTREAPGEVSRLLLDFLAR